MYLCSINRKTVILFQVKKIILAPVISVKPVGVWCNKSALDLQTLRKIIAIKSFVKCLLAKLSQDDIEKFYVLLSSVAAGMLTIEGLKPSLTEMSWLRLTSGCSILKLCSSKFFWQKLKLKQFMSLTTLLYNVRSIRQMAEVLIGKMWLKGSETYQVVPDFPRRYFHLEQGSETIEEIQ
ncbi:uncharacterized protein LOC124613764 [Schistocerca americana]|uniref:uncharacterized protein LOC124613764 n=1 Tax=Schistocerca americana TaxID=7009 RepID=UPI001F4FFEC7|nr:uncharacterized protein LOC124613764 [Schistocerca americana]